RPRWQHIVGHDLAAEASAQEGDVALHVVGGAAGRVRHRLLARRDRLDRAPDLDRALAIARRGIYRLKRRMRDVRENEAPLNDLGGATLQDFSRLPPAQRSDAVLGVQAG